MVSETLTQMIHRLTEGEADGLPNSEMVEIEIGILKILCRALLDSVAEVRAWNEWRETESDRAYYHAGRMEAALRATHLRARNRGILHD